MIGTLLLVAVILLLLGAIPAWPYSANWGYAPTGILGALLLIVVILLLLGILPFQTYGNFGSSGDKMVDTTTKVTDVKVTEPAKK